MAKPIHLSSTLNLIIKEQIRHNLADPPQNIQHEVHKVFSVDHWMIVTISDSLLETTTRIKVTPLEGM